MAATAPTAIPRPAPTSPASAIEATIDEQISAMISGIAKERNRIPPSGSVVVRNGDTLDFYPSQAAGKRRAEPLSA